MAIVQMHRLGKYGRFGNQVFQYMFLRTYAKRSGLVVHTPYWVGKDVFGLDDPLPVAGLRTVKESRVYDAEKSKVIGRSDINVVGYFQYHTSYYSADRDWIRRLFSFVNDMQSFEVRTVGVHLRREDHKDVPPYFRTPVNWIKQQLGKLDFKHVFVSSDEDVSNELIFASVEYGKPDDALYDFHKLTLCDVLLIANSSFSFVSSMLGKAVECYRPDYNKQAFVGYDPWDSYSILR